MFSSKDLFFTPAVTTGYQIAKSLRFRSSATAYLSRTFGSPTDNLKWTWSGWAKLGAFPTSGYGRALFSGGQADSGNNTTGVFLNTSNQLYLNAYSGGANQARPITTAVYRDPSAWYHVVCVYDSANATQANRFIFYVNGIRQDVTGTLLSSSLASKNNVSGATNRIGMEDWATSAGFDGYLAEVNFIDGQALTPSSFGTTDATTGVWKPIAYTGTYGTNGFYLKFADNSALTTASNVGLGKDSSPNANYWVTNGISITSGTTYDSMTDSPTPYDNGANGAGNYCVLNPVDYVGTATYSEANLKAVAAAGSANVWGHGTVAMTGGKYYFEAYMVQAGSNGNVMLGVMDATYQIKANPYNSYTWLFDNNGDGSFYKRNNGVATSYGARSSNTCTAMIAVDMDNDKIWFGIDGTWFSSGDPAAGTNAAYTNLTPASLIPVFNCYTNTGGTDAITCNFGQRPFTYTPPSGFKALNTYNLPTPTIAAGNKYFDATTYAGSNSSQSITNSGAFQPDLVWIKSRNTADDHNLVDSVRGANLNLASDTTAAEVTASRITSFNLNGVTLGGGFGATNAAGQNFVGWQWNAGGSTVIGYQPTGATIPCNVRANPTAGFSVVTFTCPASGNFTVGHGLGVVPNMIIVKSRSTAGNNWCVVHSSMTSMAAYFMQMNTTIAQTNNTSIWANTAPTSSVFSMGTNVACSPSDTAVAYCFAAVAGYSAFGTWQNNGSTDGSFIYLGFRPKAILFKNSDNVENWYFIDTSRNTYNVAPAGGNWLQPNTSNSETTAATNVTTAEIDMLSNGFKIRTTSTASGEVSYGTRNYIYAAWAEVPFKYALAR